MLQKTFAEMTKSHQLDLQTMFAELVKDELTLPDRQQLLWNWVRTGKCGQEEFQMLLPLITSAGFDLAVRHVKAQEATWGDTDVPAFVVFDQLEKNLKHLKVLMLDPKDFLNFEQLTRE